MTAALTTTRYGYIKHLPGRAFAEVRTRVAEALKAEGFGVLTEIDVQATLKQKLDVDMGRYLILGACNPHLAHRALGAEAAIGLLLPCNVCLWEEAAAVVVAIARPDAMFELVANPAVADVAREADERLRRALDAL